MVAISEQPWEPADARLAVSDLLRRLDVEEITLRIEPGAITVRWRRRGEPQVGADNWRTYLEMCRVTFPESYPRDTEMVNPW